MSPAAGPGDTAQASPPEATAPPPGFTEEEQPPATVPEVEVRPLHEASPLHALPPPEPDHASLQDEDVPSVATPRALPGEWDRVRALPHVGDVWAGVRVPAEAGAPDASSIDICMWADMKSRATRTYATIPRSSPPGELARLLLEACVNPMGAAPVGRPRGVIVAPRAERECLATLLPSLDIACEDIQDQDVFDMMEIEGQPVAMVPELSEVPGLGEGAGMELRELEWFYEAAMEFWVAAPWRFADHDSLVRLDGVLPDAPIYASLLGASSGWRGLTLFFDEAAAREMAGPDPDLRVLQQSLVLRVLFVPPGQCGSGPVNDARRLGWSTPVDDVYPVIVRWNPQPLYGLPAPEEMLHAALALKFIAELPFEARKDVGFQASTTEGRHLKATWPVSLKP